MKKIGIFVISMIIFGLFFIGCTTTNSSKTVTNYYYEIFRISIDNYNKVARPEVTYEAIKAYKDSLKNDSVEFMGFGSDATQDDIYSILTQRGTTPQVANDYISVINSIGNNLFAFYYVDDNKYYIVMYFEKL